jgi:ATP-dependent Lon protease
MVDENRKLLSGGGVWCVLTMAYSHADETDMRWVIADLKPIQVSNVDLEEYKSLRANFSTDEWVDVLMHSIGLLPETFSRRDKFIQLSRLIPHVENNYNFIELGPKGTGKSHIFSELSPHGVLVSGGDVSKARLFVNNTGNKIGLVGFWDVVALDEFEQEKGGKRTDGDLVKIMQNYMANQSFNRGKETYQATASMAFVGNTKHNVPYMLKNSHLFESIPEGYIKGAFLDRMHMYIPGWEVRILKSSVFSNEYGFIVDYLAELLRELRKADYSVHLDGKIKLDGSLTTRDKTAVRKSFSGLAKILYPHGEITDTELLELLDFAIEGRKRVKDQLYIIDETFKAEPVEFKYTVLSSGQEVTIETLENQNYKAAVEVKKEEDSEDEVDLGQGENPTPKPELQTGQVILKDNQTGISYKKLFAEYLKGAERITVQDPYIRFAHQYRNFVEFCLMLSNNKSPDALVRLELVTWNDEEYQAESISYLEEIKGDVASLGIELSYRMEKHHDRYVAADNGWKITMGRGLDIFERNESRFDISNLDQTKRKCKACEFTYIKI